MQMPALNFMNASTNISGNDTTSFKELTGEFGGNSPLIVFKVTYYSICSLISIIGNGLLITAVFKRPTLQRISYYLVSNLAMKDLTFAVISPILTLPGIYTNKQVLGHVTCMIFGVLSHWLAYTELLLLAAIALDRYFACIYPLRYHELVTHKRFRIGLVFCRAYSLFWALVPLTGFGGYRYKPNLQLCQLEWSPQLLSTISTVATGAFLFFPGTGIIIFSYLKIYRGAKNIGEPPVFSLQARPNETAKPTVPSRTTSRINKATLTVSLITGIYFLCWIPYVGIRMSQRYVNSFDENEALLLIEETTIYTFTIANFANPIVYGIYNREFRSECKKLFKR